MTVSFSPESQHNARRPVFNSQQSSLLESIDGGVFGRQSISVEYFAVLASYEIESGQRRLSFNVDANVETSRLPKVGDLVIGDRFSREVTATIETEDSDRITISESYGTPSEAPGGRDSFIVVATENDGDLKTGDRWYVSSREGTTNNYLVIPGVARGFDSNEVLLQPQGEITIRFERFVTGEFNEEPVDGLRRCVYTLSGPGLSDAEIEEGVELSAVVMFVRPPAIGWNTALSTSIAPIGGGGGGGGGIP